MNDELDIHTHTIASGHAYSTMREMIDAAKNKGLKLIGISDHAPKMPGSAHEYYFYNFRAVPREAYGIKLLLGAELNIMDYNGGVDLSEEVTKELDYAIASFHDPCIRPGTKAQNTAAMIGVMKNPAVLIIGHPDNPHYEVDFDEVARTAAEQGVLLELNNHSYGASGYRVGSRDIAVEMLKMCRKYGTRVIMGSDAHIDLAVGNHENSIEVIKANNFPEEQVINTDYRKLYESINERRKRFVSK